MTPKEIEELATIIHHAAERGESGDGYARIGNTIAFKAASALRQLLNAQKWRPLSEAPTDGTRILGCIAGEHSDQVEVIFNAKGTGWFNQSAEISMWNAFPPTHWMPLPLPPSPEEENGDA